MNRRFAYFITDEKSGSLPGLILCGALFMCGIVAGSFSAGFVSDASSLTGYFAEYLRLTEDGAFAEPTLTSSLVNTLRYPALVFCLGLSIPGVLGVPIVSAVRGYTLAFSAAVIVRLYGGGGVLLALSMFGAGTLITVPCFLILAAQSFRGSCLLTLWAARPGLRSGQSPYSARFFLCCLVCFAILAAAAVLDTYLTGKMVRFAVTYI